MVLFNCDDDDDVDASEVNAPIRRYPTLSGVFYS